MITYDDIFPGVAEVDRRCYRCGRHISELKNFEDPEYSQVAVFQNMRMLQEQPTNRLYAEIKKAIQDCDESEDLWDFYGRDNVRRALTYDPARSPTLSIECADCGKEEGDFYHYSWKDKWGKTVDNDD